MKKIILLSLLTSWLKASSVFGQGYFWFTASKSAVWDGFTTPSISTVAATVNTAFLWAAANTVPTVDSYMASVPTTATTYNTGNLNGNIPYWNAILNGQFTLAVNNNTSALVTQLSSAYGSIYYNGGIPFPVAGTTVNTTYTVYLIGWDAHYATPALAAAGHAAVGWSQPFQYTAYAPTDPLITTFAGLTPGFGTFGPNIPEPTSQALVSLGGLALVSFRRWKR